ncbi:MAG: transposon-transfer assisting family protein [Clostridiales bacterium]|jgi:hypothetical protein|nr:transposon-transfer assisting family protein [Clostridiales bacterium]
MNQEVFTVEEENLICIFDTESRAALIDGIRAAMPDFDEHEMTELADNVVIKLEGMTDADFSALTFCPADDGETEA